MGKAAPASHSIHSGSQPPCKPGEGDLWIQDPSLDLMIFHNGSWVTAAAQPVRSRSCSVSGTHQIGAEDPHDIVRYVDGLIVGYCEFCDERVTLPYMPGGLDVSVLRDFGAMILEHPTDGSLWLQFQDQYERVKSESDALLHALSEADLVQDMLRRCYESGRRGA